MTDGLGSRGRERIFLKVLQQVHLSAPVIVPGCCGFPDGRSSKANLLVPTRYVEDSFLESDIFTHGSFSKYELRKGDREGQTPALHQTGRPRVMEKTPHGRLKTVRQFAEIHFGCEALYIAVFIFKLKTSCA